MKYGFVLPWGDARTAAELAALAERAGWDGFFVWEPVWGVDAWVMLAAAAMSTERIRLGTMLTPLPRRRPWDLAGQAAAVDNLSGGRVILSVGLGAAHAGWLAFEPDPGRKIRAQLLDEGLDVLAGLWAGQPFDYTGEHYQDPPLRLHAPTTAGPAAAHPDLGGRRLAGAALDAPGRALGRLAAQPGRRGRGGAAVAGADSRGYPVDPRPAHLEGLPVDGYDVVCEGTTPAGDPEAAGSLVAPWQRGRRDLVDRG